MKRILDFVLANDPDADRFCAAERSASGAWHIFSGNEMGIILAHKVLSQYQHKPGFDLRIRPSLSPLTKGNLAMLSSAVSSKMLGAMAAKEGFHHEETLTGFKWMGNRSLELVARGYIVPYAFEEAIGYMLGDIVRDKDGIAAATLFLKVIIDLYTDGKTLLQLLEELYER